jgi:hypothetical protein
MHVKQRIIQHHMLNHAVLQRQHRTTRQNTNVQNTMFSRSTRITTINSCKTTRKHNIILLIKRIFTLTVNFLHSIITNVKK